MHRICMQLKNSILDESNEQYSYALLRVVRNPRTAQHAGYPDACWTYIEQRPRRWRDFKRRLGEWEDLVHKEIEELLHFSYLRFVCVSHC